MAAGERRWHSLAAVLASALAVGLTVGMAAPLLSLGLNAQGHDAGVVGLNAATTTLAMFAVGPLVPRLMRRVGAVPAMVAGLALSALCLLLFPFFESLFAWFLLRLLLGGLRLRERRPQRGIDDIGAHHHARTAAKGLVVDALVLVGGEGTDPADTDGHGQQHAADDGDPDSL